MTTHTHLTQVQLVKNHILNIGPIDSDEGRERYSIVDFPKVISTVGKTIPIRHIPINRPNPTTGKIRQIMKYVLERKKKPINE
jgi:hypothetical protein